MVISGVLLLVLAMLVLAAAGSTLGLGIAGVVLIGGPILIVAVGGILGLGAIAVGLVMLGVI
jgi:hypothetical protein